MSVRPGKKWIAMCAIPASEPFLIIAKIISSIVECERISKKIAHFNTNAAKIVGMQFANHFCKM
jgi:hypothetical protein